MNRRLSINKSISTPIYTQILTQIEDYIINGEYPEGFPLPSMNSLAEELKISKETIKKAYLILKGRGLIEATQGKGFYVKTSRRNRHKKIIFIFDQLDASKQQIIQNHINDMNECIEITIRIHNNNLYVLERMIHEVTGHYDGYIVTASFAQVKQSEKFRTLLKRIPSNKLVLL